MTAIFGGSSMGAIADYPSAFARLHLSQPALRREIQLGSTKERAST
jgi:hypothetical protein